MAADIAGYTRKCITSLLFPATKLKMILTYLNPGQNDSMELILRLKYHISKKRNENKLIKLKRKEFET